MATTYKTFDEIKEPKLRHTIEVLAKLYHNGDLNEALTEFNDIEIIMGVVHIDNPQDKVMLANLRFANHQ